LRYPALHFAFTKYNFPGRKTLENWIIAYICFLPQRYRIISVLYDYGELRTYAGMLDRSLTNRTELQSNRRGTADCILCTQTHVITYWINQ